MCRTKKTKFPKKGPFRNRFPIFAVTQAAMSAKEEEERTVGEGDLATRHINLDHVEKLAAFPKYWMVSGVSSNEVSVKVCI